MTPGREHLKQGVEAGQSEGQTSCFTQVDSVCWEAVCNNSEGIDQVELKGSELQAEC